jgi:hypothetical protein
VNLLISGICCEYVSWRKSKPFDIGNTCNSGITQIEKRLNKILGEPSKLEANLD